MRSTLQLGQITGIKIGIHYTWLFAFILIAWSLAIGYFPLLVQAPASSPTGCSGPWLHCSCSPPCSYTS